MGQEVVITSVTANTPVDIYYCDSLSADCVSVATVSVFPFTFTVPDPYDYTDFVIKIIDTQGCVDGDIIYITPTPTANVTPSYTNTPTMTSTPTFTPTNTITQTPTNTNTPTNTPTHTQTQTPAAVVSLHLIGQNLNSLSANSCSDTVTLTNYYTYISEADTVPVVGVKIYTTLVGGILYNPFNGQDKWLKMGFGGNYYAVLIDTSGNIANFVICT